MTLIVLDPRQRPGARTVVPPRDIPEVGRFAVLQDPQGAHFSIIRLRSVDIPTQGRATQGVRLINIEEKERVVAVARLAEKEEFETVEKNT